jgi:hypothetical protein
MRKMNGKQQVVIDKEAFMPKVASQCLGRTRRPFLNPLCVIYKLPFLKLMLAFLLSSVSSNEC